MPEPATVVWRKVVAPGPPLVPMVKRGTPATILSQTTWVALTGAGVAQLVVYVPVAEYGAAGTMLFIDPELSIMNMKFGGTLFCTAGGTSSIFCASDATQ